MPQGKFPEPYLNTTKEDDSIMKRVDQDKSEIGARNSGLPKDVKSSNMGIDHVGESAS